MNPKISVCIPVRNGGVFLPLAINSVLTQSYQKFELVVVDNCSNDGTTEWLAERLPKDRNIRIFRNSTELGIAANFNACLALASGDYVKFLCADDLLLPGCLSRLAERLDADPSVALITGARCLIDEYGDRIGIARYAKAEAKVTGTTVIGRCIFGSNYVGEPSAVMFRRNAAQRGFNENLSLLMDLEMWFHLLERGDMINLASEVCAVRRHAGQMTHSTITSGALLNDNILLFANYGTRPYIRNTMSNRMIRKIRMAYRIWLCRDGLPDERRRLALKEHSLKLCYYAIALLFGVKTNAKRPSVHSADQAEGTP
jgi:glycosyltransferase involved in cell wall biosynthesis